jgi:hypothetical protein
LHESVNTAVELNTRLQLTVDSKAARYGKAAAGTAA